MKKLTRLISFLIASALIAASLPLAILAKEENTPKEEVIYISLDHDGSVKEIYAVNVFELDEDGKIIDYGKYEAIRNMTGTESLEYADGTVTVDAKAGKLYYEGKLSSNIIPWNISIRYFIDGTEYTASEAAGKSGALKIEISITENEECAGDFFEGYALQTSFTLDTNKCKNIVADGATLANVGSDKQITYTILPGSGASISVTADVKDFEMSSISLNGVKLRLNIEIEDDKIDELISQIQTAIADIDDGTGKLQDGSKDLAEGAGALVEGADKLQGGIGELFTGSETLAGGLAEIVSNNKELKDGAWAAFEGICSAANTMLNAQLKESGIASVKLTPSNYSRVLNDLLKKLNADAIYDKAYATALAQVTKEVEANQDALYKGYIEQIAPEVYRTYIMSISQSLYEQVAASVFKNELLGMGFSEERADAMINEILEDGRISELVDKITDEQKETIISTALASLTDEQKKEIREGAVKTLTSAQKKEIRDGYIEQMMKSEEVTQQITDAVSAAVGTAATSITSLKGQLDNFSLFYDGLVEYTDAVEEAASGSQLISDNMSALFEGVSELSDGADELGIGANLINTGVNELKEGTSEFRDRTSNIDELISDMIDSVLSSSGDSGSEISSFISEDNVNVNSVQFVIKTPAIVAPAPAADVPPAEEKLNFWQKLLRLFGLY